MNKTISKLIRQRRKNGGPYNKSLLNSAYLNAYECECLGKTKTQIEARCFYDTTEEDIIEMRPAVQAGREQAMADMDAAGL